MAVILAVAFLGLELNLRLLGGPIQIFNPLNGFHEGDPVLGWRGQADIARRFHTPEFDVLVRHDGDGFRQPEPARPPHPARNVLILGDSLGWGWGVDQGELFSDHLQRRLAPATAVYNRSVNAYSTGQELLLLDRELATRDYDDVLVIVSQTDIGDNADDKRHRPAFDLRDGELVPRNQPPPGHLKSAFARFIDDHFLATHFLSWQAAALKRWWQTRSAARPEIPLPAPDDDGVTIAAAADQPRDEDAARALPGYAVSERLLVEIARRTAAHGARLHLAYATTYHHTRDRPEQTGFRDLVRSVAERTSASFLDLNEAIEAVYQSGELALIPKDGHWSPAGHRGVAEALLTSGTFVVPAAHAAAPTRPPER